MAVYQISSDESTLKLAKKFMSTLDHWLYGHCAMSLLCSMLLTDSNTFEIVLITSLDAHQYWVVLATVWKFLGIGN